ncbi:hypothetical protein CR513_02136, partial [Mucuna pruriens]
MDPKLRRAICAIANVIVSRVVTVEDGELLALTRPIWLDAKKLKQEVQVNPSLSRTVAFLLKDLNVYLNYTLEQGRLFYKGRLVISPTSSWIPLLLKEFHATPVGGHSSAYMTYKRLAVNLYWPRMITTITKYVAACTIC